MEHHNRIFISMLLALPLMILGISGCYYDNEEELYPASAECVTENMSYASDIWPVIDSRCVGCHGGASPAGDIPLENYDDVAASAAIGEGNYGSLYGAISYASGNSPMPKGSDKLSDCTISKFKAWIDQGSQNN